MLNDCQRDFGQFSSEESSLVSFILVDTNGKIWGKAKRSKQITEVFLLTALSEAWLFKDTLREGTKRKRIIFLNANGKHNTRTRAFSFSTQSGLTRERKCINKYHSTVPSRLWLAQKDLWNIFYEGCSGWLLSCGILSLKSLKAILLEIQKITGTGATRPTCTSLAHD